MHRFVIFMRTNQDQIFDDDTDKQMLCEKLVEIF